MRKNRLTDNVRAKIAFDIFSTNMTHLEIANKYNIARSTVSNIAREFNLQRHRSRPGNHSSASRRKHKKSDIDTVNWTFDENLVLKRIQRREEKISKEIHRLIKAATMIY